MPFIIKTNIGPDDTPIWVYWNGSRIGWSSAIANIYQGKESAEKIARSLPNYELAIVQEIPS